MIENLRMKNRWWRVWWKTNQIRRNTQSKPGVCRAIASFGLTKNQMVHDHRFVDIVVVVALSKLVLES
jgi:hypothetical protein